MSERNHYATMVKDDDYYSINIIRNIYSDGKPDSFRINYPWGHAHNVGGQRSIIDLHTEDLTPNMLVEICSADLNEDYTQRRWAEFTTRAYTFSLPKSEADEFWVTGINKTKI